MCGARHFRVAERICVIVRCSAPAGLVSHPKLLVQVARRPARDPASSFSAECATERAAVPVPRHETGGYQRRAELGLRATRNSSNLQHADLVGQRLSGQDELRSISYDALTLRHPGFFLH